MTSQQLATENEFDILRIFQLLWNGKLWIMGLALLFAVGALVYSYLVKPEWTSASILTRPSITALGSYYEQQQFINSVAGSASATSGNTIINDVYRAFLQKLNSYDTQRDFWLQSDYYQQRQEGDQKADAVLLNELIGNIRLSLSSQKSPTDNILLIAETGPDAQQLLKDYITFAANKAVGELNQDLNAVWQDRQRQLMVRQEQLQAAAEAAYQRNLKLLTQSLDSVGKLSKEKGESHQIVESDVLQYQIDSLMNEGPQYGDEYYQAKVLLKRFAEPLQQTSFQPYDFLRTPDEPIKRTSPRRLFLLVLWGAIGAFCGSVVALIRRRNVEISYN